MDQYHFILASSSPRRRELLTQMGVERFDVIPAKGEEEINTSDPEIAVKSLSLQKAKEVFEDASGQISGSQKPLVIGADTVVVLDGEIIGKPADRQDAYDTLTRMQGQTHKVYTGVTVMTPDKTLTFHAESAVTFAPLTPEEIRAYVDSGEADDKAGSYGVQGIFGRYIDRINGEYYNVVGLPIASLYRTLKDDFGICFTEKKKDTRR